VAFGVYNIDYVNCAQKIHLYLLSMSWLGGVWGPPPPPPTPYPDLPRGPIPGNGDTKRAVVGAFSVVIISVAGWCTADSNRTVGGVASVAGHCSNYTVARSRIPAGITHDDVVQAIADLKAGTVSHGFHESERYDLVYNGERFAPKAVLGVAARRVAGRILVPADFSGGESSTCFRVLRALGFQVELKPGQAALTLPNFVIGQEYNRRRDIHAIISGQEMGGISTPADFPVVLLFTGASGDVYGYEDKFRNDGVFLYTGEGQVGDMKFDRGNIAIRDSTATGKELLLFEQRRKGFVHFVGRAKYLGHHIEQRPDSKGAIRDAIIFELDVDAAPQSSGQTPPPVGAPPPTLPKSLAELRSAAFAPPAAGSSPKLRMGWTRYRSEAVKRYVLKRAAGTCEGCDKPAPFLNRKRQPYLEPHHTTRVADGGPDNPAHVIALCPTCHRRVHHAEDGAEYNVALVARLAALESSQV